MKLDNQSNKVLLLHLGWLVVGALLGMWIGKPNHIMLGISLGSLLGTLIPGVYAEIALRGKTPQPNSLLHLCAAVFNNNWVTKDVNLSAVQEIRGAVYVTWFGVMVGALVAGFALTAGLFCISLGALLGGLLFWIGNRCFTL